MSLQVNANTNAIEITRGDDQTVRFTVTTSAGAVQDITGWTFKFTVKEDVDDDIVDAIFQKSTGGNGIALTTPLSGILDVTIDAADTASIAGKHVYDLQGTDTGGLVRTVTIPGSREFMVRKGVSTPGIAGQPGAVIVPFPGSISIETYIYMLDATTGLYSAIRIDNGFIQVSDTQSATLPFTPTFS